MAGDRNGERAEMAEVGWGGGGVGGVSGSGARRETRGEVSGERG